MAYDVIIIGAGLSGLAAGIRLAHYNKKVCILEKHSRVGGLNSFYQYKGRTLDVGLHALTNYVVKGNSSAPLAKLSRQLRIRLEEFDLSEQIRSCIHFPNKILSFTNNFEELRQGVAELFPEQADNFEALIKYIQDYDAIDLSIKPLSAREVITSYIKDPLLTEMIFCPLMYYGSAKEDDMDFDQFVIMFKSIFCEGFSRPYAGVQKILNLLVDKYIACGGELRLRAPVKTLATKDDSCVEKVVLEDGQELTAGKIISSAGLYETVKLCSSYEYNFDPCLYGQLSFVETILMLNKDPNEFGYDTTIEFYNDSDKFNYKKPSQLVDYNSGVICCPNNFYYPQRLSEGIIRVTNIANFDLWKQLEKKDYSREKERVFEKVIERLQRNIPFIRDMVIEKDIFTPMTIERYTGHINGAVYGAPNKIKNGLTNYSNLFLCGTDQGFLGIVGAMLSGITIANLHVLA